MEIAPPDEHNRLLVEQVHPADWQNPTPPDRYNLVAIGGGTAGLVAAAATAVLGGRAALVERQLLGGDCLNSGCVPSKALIRAARAAHEVLQSQAYGVRLHSPGAVDFPAVMQRMRRLRAAIGHRDSAARFRELGVDVFLGAATFTGRDSLEVDGPVAGRLKFRRAVIATGGRPRVPPVEGLEQLGYLTNETVFSLTELPRRLIVLGGGPVGCELAQAFRRFGSEVHLVNRRQALLLKEDPDAAQRIELQMRREGVHLHLGWSASRAEKTGGSKSLLIERQGEKQKLIADHVLVAVGRQPDVAGLGLEAAGVKYDDGQGVEVNDRLQTSNPAIYAAGDVAAVGYQFTHAADAMARLCVQNALFLGRKKFSSLVIPRCTYTDPELAHVGLTPHDARQRGIDLDSYRVELDGVDRAILDGQDAGFAVVHCRRRTGRVLGATIVAAHAGEMIGEITLLMTKRLKLDALASTIHCYPTQVEVLKQIADIYTRGKLTPRLSALAKKWLAWRR